MVKLDDTLYKENSFYSVRSDGSILLALKVRDAAVSSTTWMLVRTNTQKQVRSDHWAFSKLNDKETVSFPVVSTEELKRAAREGDFLEWQVGFAAPAQSEQELLLSEREQALEQKIQAAKATFERKEQEIQEKIQTLLEALKEREEEAKRALETQAQGKQEVIDQKSLDLETRIQAVLTDLNERQQTIQSEHDSVLTAVQDGSEKIKGEAKYFQVTLKESRETAMAEIGRQIQQAQTLIETFQHSVEAKEQTLSGLVATQTHELGEQVKTLQADLAGQQPLSAEKYRQDAARKAFWLSLWLVVAGVVFFALTLLAPLLPSANTVLIETFGSVSAFLALLIAGITFFLRTKNA